MKRILVIDEDPLWLAELSRALREKCKGDTIFTATSRVSGVRLYQRYFPSIIVCSLGIFDESGVTLHEELPVRQEKQEPTIVLLIARVTDAVLFHINGHKCSVVMKKSDFRPALYEAVHEGKLRRVVSAEVDSAMREQRRNPVALTKILSNREVSLLPLFGNGYTDLEIANRVGRSDRTVKYHRHRIMEKVEVANRCEFIRWLGNHGFTRRRPDDL